jgi:hypothetical protein
LQLFFPPLFCQPLDVHSLIEDVQTRQKRSTTEDVNALQFGMLRKRKSFYTANHRKHAIWKKEVVGRVKGMTHELLRVLGRVELFSKYLSASSTMTY